MRRLSVITICFFLLAEISPASAHLSCDTASGATTWKLYGPDLNGRYGGMNGVGGFEGVSLIHNVFVPLVADANGDLLAEYATNGFSWYPSRVTGYGAVPGYRPLPLGGGANVQRSSALRGKWSDITGYIWMGARYYVPETGSWLSYDPIWNDRDPSGFTYCGGDPINRTDSNGKLSKQNSINSVSSPFHAPSAPYITSDSFTIPQIDLSKSQQSGNYDSSIPSMGPANPYSTGSPINSGYQSAPNPFTTDALTIGMGNVSQGQRDTASAINANLYQTALTMAIGSPAVAAENTTLTLDTATTWGKADTLADHFARHGADFGAQTADEYANMASQFLQDSQRARLPTKIDSQGVIRVFDQQSGSFGSFNANGTTRTFFKPSSPTYFDRQPGTLVP